MTEYPTIKIEELQTSRNGNANNNFHDSKNEDSINNSLTNNKDDLELLYNLKQKPPTVLSIFLALQVVMVIIYNIIWLPYIITPSLCIHPDDPARIDIISSSIFVSGISTLFFSTVGQRLPILLLPSTYYLSSLLKILQQPELKCPAAIDIYAMGHENRTEEWKKRLKYLQGSILVISSLQVLLGLTGITDIFDRMLSDPLVLAPATIIVGLTYANQVMNLTMESNFPIISNTSNQWGTIILAIMAVLITGFKFHKIEWITPSYSLKKGWSITYFMIFKLFPIYFAAFLVLLIYPVFLTLINGKIYEEKFLLEQSLEDSEYFLLHRPFEFGWPTFHMQAFIQLIPAALTQILISILVFRVTHFMYGQTIKRTYINKGIFLEGICGLISGTFGINAVSSPINIGFTQLTGVGSRWIIQLTGVFLIFFSLSSQLVSFLCKISPLFVVTILFVISALVSVTGLSMIRKINLSSVRSCTAIGLTLYSGIVIPKYITTLSSHYTILQILIEIFSSHIIVCVIFGSVIDYLLPKSKHPDILEESSEIDEDDDQKFKLSPCEEILACCL